MAMNATAYAYENVGLLGVQSRDAGVYANENVGAEKPVTTDFGVPQQGWGTPMLPSQTVTLRPSLAQATLYAYEEIVE